MTPGPASPLHPGAIARDAEKSLVLAEELARPGPAAGGAAIDRMLRAFGRLRDHKRLTPDEVLIFLAIGRLGVMASSLGVAIHPVTCLDVSKLLKIPSETVRRKAARLVEAEFLTRTTRGLLIRNIEEWRRQTELFVNNADEYVTKKQLKD